MELIDVLGVKRRAKVNENVDYGIKALTWTLRNHGVRESKTRFYLRIYCNHRLRSMFAPQRGTWGSCDFKTKEISLQGVGKFVRQKLVKQYPAA